MKIELMDENINLHFLKNTLKTDKSEYSSFFRHGYDLKCFALPRAPFFRRVGGLPDITFTLNNKSLLILSPKKYAFFLAIILATEYSNSWEDIEKIYLNEKIRKSIKLSDIVLLENNISLEIIFKDELSAAWSNSSIYYLISPYRHNAYYLDKELSKW